MTMIEKPTRGFGDNPDDDGLDERWDSLDDGGDSPRPGALNVKTRWVSLDFYQIVAFSHSLSALSAARQ